MSSETSWQTLSIFLSSTFHDMKAERDTFRARVLPGLEKRLKEAGLRCHVRCIDLRWGVDTADISDPGQRELKVLDCCFRTLRDSRPLVVALLGDRYGWIPPLERARAAVRRAGFTRDPSGMSITHMEMEFAAFNKDLSLPTLFCLRKPLPYESMDEDERARFSDAHSADPEIRRNGPRLKDLKERIQKNIPSDRVRTYSAGWDARSHSVTGLTSWADDLVNDLWKHLAQQLKVTPKTDATDDASQALEAFIEERVRATNEIVEGVPRAINALLGRLPTPIVSVSGAPGSGKSTFFAQAALAVRETDALVLASSLAVPPMDARPYGFLAPLVASLCDRLGRDLPTDPRTSLPVVFADLLAMDCRVEPVILLLDSVDQLPRGQQPRRLFWLPSPLPRNLRLLVTSSTRELDSELAAMGRVLPLSMEGLDSRRWRRCLELRAQAECKEINPRILATLEEKISAGGAPALANPLWLRTATDLLFEVGEVGDDPLPRPPPKYPWDVPLPVEVRAREDERPTRGKPYKKNEPREPGFFEKLWSSLTRRSPVEPKSTPDEAARIVQGLVTLAKRFPPQVDDLCETLLDVAEGRFGQELCRPFLGLLATHPEGLSLADLERILEHGLHVKRDHLAQEGLCHLLAAHLTDGGQRGQIRLVHDSFLTAVRRRTTRGGADPELHRVLAEQFVGYAMDDPSQWGPAFEHLLQGRKPQKTLLEYMRLDWDRKQRAANDAIARCLLLDDPKARHPVRKEILRTFNADLWLDVAHPDARTLAISRDAFDAVVTGGGLPLLVDQVCNVLIPTIRDLLSPADQRVILEGLAAAIRRREAREGLDDRLETASIQLYRLLEALCEEMGDVDEAIQHARVLSTHSREPSSDTRRGTTRGALSRERSLREAEDLWRDGEVTGAREAMAQAMSDEMEEDWRPLFRDIPPSAIEIHSSNARRAAATHLLAALLWGAYEGDRWEADRELEKTLEILSDLQSWAPFDPQAIDLVARAQILRLSFATGPALRSAREGAAEALRQLEVRGALRGELLRLRGRLMGKAPDLSAWRDELPSWKRALMPFLGARDGMRGLTALGETIMTTGFPKMEPFPMLPFGLPMFAPQEEPEERQDIEEEIPRLAAQEERAHAAASKGDTDNAIPLLLDALGALDLLLMRCPGNLDAVLRRISVLSEVGSLALGTVAWELGLEWLEKASVASQDFKLLERVLPGHLETILQPNLLLATALSERGEQKKAREKLVFCVQVLSRERMLGRLPPAQATLLDRLEADPRYRGGGRA